MAFAVRPLDYLNPHLCTSRINFNGFQKASLITFLFTMNKFFFTEAP